MHIQIEGDTVGRYDLRWRGVALSNFDGTSWFNPRERVRPPAELLFVSGCGASQPAAAILCIARQGRDHMIHYRVVMEPIGTNVFFLAPWARRVTGDYRMLAADSVGCGLQLRQSSTRSPTIRRNPIFPTPAPAELRAARTELSAANQGAYLRLPALDPRIPRLAAQITVVEQRFRQSGRHRKLSADALWLYPAAAADESKRSARKFSLRTQTRTLRVLRLRHGGDVAHAGNTLARGQWISQ